MAKSGNEIVEARAIHRVPEVERWDKALLQAITATPWERRIRDDVRSNIEVIPPLGDGLVQQQSRTRSEIATNIPRSFYILPEDLEKYGYTFFSSNI